MGIRGTWVRSSGDIFDRKSDSWGLYLKFNELRGYEFAGEKSTLHWRVFQKVALERKELQRSYLLAIENGGNCLLSGSYFDKL